MSGGIDPTEVQKRFDRLGEILGGIVTQADAQAAQRCPYRDRHDTCTARFRCRNQAPQGSNQASANRNQAPEHTQITPGAGTGNAPGTDAPLLCTHDGGFDYRSAWESDPRAADIARARLARSGRRVPPPTPDGPSADRDAPAPQD